jgi:hypothetical protein
VARHIALSPELVKGKRVIDVAAGCGVGAVVAALAGASEVIVYVPSLPLPFRPFASLTSDPYLPHSTELSKYY